MPDDIVEEIRQKRIVCSVLANTISGPAWQRHEARSQELARKAEMGERADPPKWDSAWQVRRRRLERDEDIDVRRRNAQKLIASGCLITIGTDNQWGAAPEFRSSPNTDEQDAGTGTLRGLEGLVELGMSPSAAIVAATRNGAFACRQTEEFGTLEAGKSADLVVLEGDPLVNIANVRRRAAVMIRGVLVDLDRLPEDPVFAPAAAM